MRKKVFFILLLLLCRFIKHITGEKCGMSKRGDKLRCTRLKYVPLFANQLLSATHIDLSKNSIQLIPSTSFTDFSKVRYVNLSRNSINRVEQETFKYKQFEWIDLSYNKLTTLGRDVFPSDSVLQKKAVDIFLHNNPWDCTCALKWMIDFIKESLIKPRLSQPKCFTPRKLQGTRLSALEDEDYCVIQECLECDDAAHCRVNGSSYQCVCKPTYNGNGKFCADVDECAKSLTNVCKSNEICENFSGGYKCTCSTGYERKDGQCKDVNECQPPPVGCGPGQGICKNTIGSYQCICHPGLQYVSGSGCIDVDECKSDIDPCEHVSHSTCVNTAFIDLGDKGYDCICDDGYVMSGEACIPTANASKTFLVLIVSFVGIVLLVVIITSTVVVWRRTRPKKSEEKQAEFMMAPITMTTPMDFAFMDMPQVQEDRENDEWKDVDSDDDF